MQFHLLMQFSELNTLQARVNLTPTPLLMLILVRRTSQCAHQSCNEIFYSICLQVFTLCVQPGIPMKVTQRASEVVHLVFG